jgi:hypothetical protein
MPIPFDLYLAPVRIIMRARLKAPPTLTLPAPDPYSIRPLSLFPPEPLVKA